MWDTLPPLPSTTKIDDAGVVIPHFTEKTEAQEELPGLFKGAG